MSNALRQNPNRCYINETRFVALTISIVGELSMTKTFMHSGNKH